MSMTWIDWMIVIVTLGLMMWSVVFTKKFMKSVADFLAAGRTAGRYLITVSMGMAMLGSITIVGEFELFYKSGFCLRWWELSMAVAILIVTVSGWVVYRFRQTRSLTLAQFFEMRYSRNFRVFAGILAFVSGLINFGIFPSVGARFFIHYCGLPETFAVSGIPVSMYALLMILLLAISIFFVFAGGQVAVIIADFIQGLFTNAVFMILIFYFLFTLDWSKISAAMATLPAEASLSNPFKTSQVEDFNFWYFLIGLIGFIYNFMSWQGTQGYNVSSRSAHESKMAQVLGNWRNYPRNLFLMFIPVVAVTVLRHPDFSSIAGSVNGILATLESPEIQSQMRVPLVLRFILPAGLLGAFAAVMLSAFISCHDTYLHSWGSIFIQDIVMPIRKKPFTPRQHLRVLRLSIVGVAVFIFLFSLFFRQSQHIYLFFAITAAIFVGGSGAVIIGGLYWKRGTTAAAWAAMITGSGISVAGIVLHQIYKDFPINGQWFWGISMVAASLVYVVVSLLGKRQVFDLDRILHRGKHAIQDETTIVDAVPSKGWRVLGMGKEFTAGDKVIYIASYAWIFLWTAVFIVGTVYALTHDVRDAAWMEYWRVYVILYAAVSAIVMIWFGIGGCFDIREMFRRLKIMKRDDSDDGYIQKG